MAIKTLLLDVDGVLIRDKELLDHVRHNCVQYVKKKMPECKSPGRLNRQLYMKHGHTATGLKLEHNIDTSDFEKEVYTAKLKSHLWSVLSSNEFQQDAEVIHEIASKDWKVCLFTNAPIEWSGQVGHAISDLLYIKTPDSQVYKPDPGFYTGLPSHNIYLYVDDCIRNLKASERLHNCHPILFSDNTSSPYPTISSIWELQLYVNSVDQWIADA